MTKEREKKGEIGRTSLVAFYESVSSRIRDGENWEMDKEFLEWEEGEGEGEGDWLWRWE